MDQQWSLGTIHRHSAFGSVEDFFSAASHNNIAIFALHACECLGTTLAISTESKERVQSTLRETTESFKIQSLQDLLGVENNTCSILLFQSAAGVNFLALAAALVSALGTSRAAETLSEMIEETAADWNAAPSTCQLKHLLDAIETGLSQVGFVDVFLYWHCWWMDHKNELSHSGRSLLEVEEHAVPFSAKDLTELVGAFRGLRRRGNTGKIIITVGRGAPWLTAFTFWCLGTLPTMRTIEGKTLLDQPKSMVNLLFSDNPSFPMITQIEAIYSPGSLVGMAAESSHVQQSNKHQTDFDNKTMTMLPKSLQNDDQTQEMPKDIFDSDEVISFKDSAYETTSETSSMIAITKLPGLREEMLDLLINDTLLQQSGREALTKFGADRFEHRFKKMLCVFARELKQEALWKDQRGAAYILWYYATYTAHCARNHWSGVEDSQMTEMLARLPEKKIELNYSLNQHFRRPGLEHSEGGNDDNLDDDQEWDENDVKELQYLEPLEHFITSSRAFQNLRKSLSEWTSPRQAQSEKQILASEKISYFSRWTLKYIYSTLVQASLLIIESFGLFDKPLARGHQRLKCACNCGEIFYQDFPDPKLARDLLDALNISGYKTWIVRSQEESDSGEGEPSKMDGFGGGHNENETMTRSENSTSARSTQHETPEQPDTGNGHPATRIWEQPRTRSTRDLPRPLPKWILLCFNDYKHSRKAEHVEINDVLSDAELFRQLWKSYSKARGVIFSLFAWKAVTKISFVQFQLWLDPRTNVDTPLINFETWAPPSEWENGGRWTPCPTQFERPVVPNWLLLHLWDHPHDAMSFKMKVAVKKRISGARTKVWTFLKTAAIEISGRADVEAQEISSVPDGDSSEFLGNRATSPAFMYTKTPKRLIKRLVANEMDPPYGWGLYFEEGFRMPLAIQYSLSVLLTGLIGGK
ncbi:uncharacterized protein PAC_01309 [Phialocephala subalpina]|uniref:Uncharacterized protein n=1 Tax=Phialocephala subalpina TaxID=576137 RepID=A0A1L7WF76_9HELO|nr:uncharacterized protein PAC_01309 [Phialocephala subalpina]